MPARTYANLFEEKLLQRVAAERQRVMGYLEGGEAVTTFEAYREHVGYLKALREIDEWCIDATTDLEKG